MSNDAFILLDANGGLIFMAVPLPGPGGAVALSGAGGLLDVDQQRRLFEWLLERT